MTVTKLYTNNSWEIQGLTKLHDPLYFQFKTGKYLERTKNEGSKSGEVTQ